MSEDADQMPQITLIPAGTLLNLRERTVTLTFHSPDDAIIFTELALQLGACERVRRDGEC